MCKLRTKPPPRLVGEIAGCLEGLRIEFDQIEGMTWPATSLTHMEICVKLHQLSWFSRLVTTLFDQIGVIGQTCGLIISFITKAVGGFINDVAAISPFGLLTAWIPQFWILILENVLFCCFLLNQSKGLMIQTQIFVDMSFPFFGGRSNPMESNWPGFILSWPFRRNLRAWSLCLENPYGLLGPKKQRFAVPRLRGYGCMHH